MAHVARPPHVAAQPVHVTLRAAKAIGCLRAERVFPLVQRALAASSHDAFRLLHFSVQDDHLHLIIEADDQRALGRGIAGLIIRVARAVNRVLGRRGAVWGDRYHCRALTTPREMRHCLAYVLLNRRKHCAREGGLDRCSSAPWFSGWKQPVDSVFGMPPVVHARTWLAAVGWKRHGLIDLAEHLRSSSRMTCRRIIKASIARPGGHVETTREPTRSGRVYDVVGDSGISR